MKNNCDALSSEIDRISRIFLSGSSVKQIVWNNTFNSWPTQEQIINCTVLHPKNVSKPTKIKYQVNFLKYIVQKLESLDAEIHDCVYDQLTRLILLSEVQDTCFKHYLTPRGVISLEERVQIISQGTTGLNTWEAALVLSEWCIDNKRLLKSKVVLELGSGIGLVGLTIALNCEPRRIFVSDCHKEVLDKLRVNIKENEKDRKLTDVIKVREIAWESVDSLVANDINPDLILAADVIYDPTLFRSFINAVRVFLDGEISKELVLVCTQRNLDTLNDFLSILRETFCVDEDKVPESRWFVWSQEVPIRIFRVTLRRN